MADVWLVRHAPTAWTGVRYCGRSDPPLDERGLEHATRLAKSLRAALPSGTRIVSSPLLRARQTAQRIAEALNQPTVEIDDRWAEADFGAVEGLTFDELAAARPDLAERLLAGEMDIDWPGGETSAALCDRVRAAWEDLIIPPGPVLLVAHAGPLRLARQMASVADQPDVLTIEPGGVWSPRALEDAMTSGARIGR
jgi:broad specificity phosphatase PhoE